MSSPSDPEKNLAVLVWWTAFGLNLFFRPAVELTIRLVLLSASTLLLGVIDGFVTLPVGHAVLKAAGCNGYDPPILSSLQAGALGGLIIIGPFILLTALVLILLCGSTTSHHRSISSHATLCLVLEIATTVAVSAAACPVGVVVVGHTQLARAPLLGTVHAARAGALGASVVTVPLIVIAAFFMPDTKAMNALRNVSASSVHLDGAAPSSTTLNENLSEHRTLDCTRKKTLNTRTAIEVVYYMLIILCTFIVRILCF